MIGIAYVIGRRLLFGLVIALVLQAPSCGGTQVRNGTARDTLWGVEPVVNGNVRIFLTHDDVAGYCTSDPALAEEVQDILENHLGEVIITYSDITKEDKEAAWYANSACGSIVTGSDGGSMKMFRLTAIRRVQARWDPGR